jgi:hypothetical protein
MRNALKEGMEIPDDPELGTDLAGPQYGFSSKQQIQLERGHEKAGTFIAGLWRHAGHDLAENITIPSSEATVLQVRLFD